MHQQQPSPRIVRSAEITGDVAAERPTVDGGPTVCSSMSSPSHSTRSTSPSAAGGSTPVIRHSPTSRASSASAGRSASSGSCTPRARAWASAPTASRPTRWPCRRRRSSRSPTTSIPALAAAPRNRRHGRLDVGHRSWADAGRDDVVVVLGATGTVGRRRAPGGAEPGSATVVAVGRDAERLAELR